jgi:hypothetical protein
MTATVIPFATLKARIDEREKENKREVAALNEADRNYFLRAMQQLRQANATRRPRTDCGEWPKWEDYL